MKHHFRICTAILAVACATLPAFAAEGQKRAADATPNDKGSYEMPGVDGNQNSRHIASANKLIDQSILSVKGEENLGEIEDIVLDQTQNRIAYVVTAYGGVFDLGETFYAVPWGMFQLAGAEDLQVSLDVDPERLEDAPGFDKDDWPETANAAFARKTHEFYGQRPYELNDQRRDEAAEDLDDQNRRDETVDARDDDENEWNWDAWMTRDNKWAQRLTTYIGLPVRNVENEDIAVIEDVVIETREGRAVYAIVSYGGVVGLFDTMAAIPFGALRIDPNQEVVVLEGDVSDLERLTLKTDDYAELDRSDFAARVHDQFGIEPYWTRTRTQDMAARAEDSKTREQRQKTREERQQARGEFTATGTIATIGTYYPADEQADEGMRLRLSTKKGTCTVHVVNRTELDDMDVDLARGDRITVTGDTKTFRGRRVVVAETIKKGSDTVDVSADREPQKAARAQ